MENLTLTVSSNCLLQGASTELVAAIKDKLTIDNPKYIAAKRYGRWIGKKLKPKLTYYKETRMGVIFPRGFSNRAVILARETMGCSPEIIDERRSLPEVNFSFCGELRDYQKSALEDVDGKSFGVLEAGTGSGKTVMALALVAKRKQPTLVVVHTKELLYQWKERIEEFLDYKAGLVGDGKFILEDITVAIVNTARKRVSELVPQFGHLIVDECHRVPASLFTDVVSVFDCKYLLGLSATAYRSEEVMTQLIYYFMGDRLHKVDQHDLTESGAIVRPQIITRPTSFFYQYRGDYHALVSALVAHEGRNIQIVEDVFGVVRENGGGTALVVSDRVSHCQVFFDQLVKRGVRVSLLTGKTPADERGQVVDEVQKGNVEVLVATLQLISEGFDCAGLNTLFLTTPISFEGRILQVIGRIMRPGKDKQARVFDYFDDEVPLLRKSALSRQKVLSRISPSAQPFDVG
jgi:superfamily II DNA or RNA helicase